MKKLTIIRHAKSSWENNVIDHERPLEESGKNDAFLVSKYLKDHMLIKPDLIWSSDAKRAKSTAEIIVTNFSIDKNSFKLKADLYDFSGANLVNAIKSCTENCNELLVFGHNHAITYFVNAFGDLYIDNVPTCGVVCIEFDIMSWKNLNKGKTTFTVFPRDLREYKKD